MNLPENLLLAWADAAPPSPTKIDWPHVYDQARDWITTNGMAFLTNLVVAIVIFIIGRIAANLVRNLIVRLLNTRKVDQTVTLFLANIAYVLLMIMVAITALGQLGVPTAQFAALIAAGGLAVGLALQGNLSNFAAGFLIILFQPFRKGDYVAGGGVEGEVAEVQVFSTIINTVDNKRVIVPNSKLTGDNLTNFTAHETRRVDLTFVVGSQNNTETVRKAMLAATNANPRVLKNPAAVALLKDANGKLIFEVRAWCKSSEYWDTYFEVTEAVNNRLAADKIGGPINFQVVEVNKN